MPWEKQYNEDFVLDRAMEAFWARGYEATSINDLIQATGINRGSLYNAFDDKHSLFMRVLDHYDRKYRRDFLANLRQRYSPKQAIVSAFKSVHDSTRSGVNRNGCLLINTAIELSPFDPMVEERVAASLDEVRAFFQSAVGDAQDGGEVSTNLAADEIARRLFSLFVSLRVTSRSCPDAELSESILQQVENLLR